MDQKYIYVLSNPNPSSLVPVNVTLFGISVFVDVIKDHKMRSSCMVI